MSDSIGIVRDFETHEILAVINPTFEQELDNPRWLLIQAAREDGTQRAVELVRVPRGDYMGAMSLAEVAELVERIKP